MGWALRLREHDTHYWYKSKAFRAQTTKRGNNNNKVLYSKQEHTQTNQIEYVSMWHLSYLTCSTGNLALHSVTPHTIPTSKYQYTSSS